LTGGNKGIQPSASNRCTGFNEAKIPMKSHFKPTLLIPVELQVRELEPKLLLACVAARRGYAAVVGPRREMHFQIPKFKRSIYLSKSTTSASYNVFRMLDRLGHKIVVWDEEALVSLPPALYFRHRLSARSMVYVSQFFAWGEANAQLWREYPEFPQNVPIHVTGNPRGDLLRPELRGFYRETVDTLRAEHGDFILVNSNFNLVNAYYPDMCLVMDNPDPGGEPVLTRRSLSMGLTREYAVAFTTYKKQILEDFKRMIPELEKAFPELTIVLRPHPAENPAVYNEIAAGCRRVKVTNQGNVVPWLLASRALVHNGCTTGVEAYALDVPALSYQVSLDDRFDQDFHWLPNRLSHQCFSMETLVETLKRILAGQLGARDDEHARRLMARHLAARSGLLASERIVGVLDQMTREWKGDSGVSISDRLAGWYFATRRRIKKRFRGYRANMSHNRPEFLHYRYPDLSRKQVQERIDCYRRLLGYEDPIEVEKFGGKFFRICS
jgi:surface carbohydrate biosynthesis protein